MSEIHDIAEERAKREMRRVLDSAAFLTVDPSEVPERPPVTAAGWAVIVRDPEGTEALAYPCETGGDEYANCLLPTVDERQTVVAALQEAIKALLPPAEQSAVELLDAAILAAWEASHVPFATGRDPDTSINAMVINSCIARALAAVWHTLKPDAAPPPSRHPGEARRRREWIVRRAAESIIEPPPIPNI